MWKCWNWFAYEQCANKKKKKKKKRYRLLYDIYFVVRWVCVVWRYRSVSPTSAKQLLDQNQRKKRQAKEGVLKEEEGKSNGRPMQTCALFPFRVPLSFLSSLSRPLTHIHTHFHLLFMDERAIQLIVSNHMIRPVGMAHIGQAIE